MHEVNVGIDRDFENTFVNVSYQRHSSPHSVKYLVSEKFCQ